MKKRRQEYPISNNAHQIGMRPLDVFNFRKPKSWIVNPATHDYGWDLIVSLKRNVEVREDFFVQLKGSELPSYSKKKDWVAINMNTSTVQWLCEKTMPTMICLCDVGKTPETLYWVWIEDALTELKKRYPAWHEKDSVTLHIPTDNLFTNATVKDIEEQVIGYYKKQHTANVISSIVLPGDFKQDLTFGPTISDELLNKAKGILDPAGICDVVETDHGEIAESHSSQDQKRFREILVISSHLEHFQDRIAEKLLDELAPEIENAADGIRARYFNNRGVLSSHKLNHSEAQEWFQKAVDLRPKNAKYMTNLLNMELAPALRSKPLEQSLPSDWITRLDEVVLTKHPQALLLKSYYLGLAKGAEAAEDFLKESGLWDDKPVTSRFYLGSILKDLGENEKAVAVLSEAVEIEDEEKKPEVWVTYGLALLRKASNTTGMENEFSIGLASSQKEALKAIWMAKESFEEAYALYMGKGFPAVALPAVVNYSAVLTFFGMHDKSAEVCSRYLDFHPGCSSVLEKMSSTLLNQGKYKEALPYAKKAYTSRPRRESTYEVLLLSLCGASDFEGAIKHVAERESAGFMSKQEEGLSRWFAAVSYYELGHDKEASELVDKMKSEPALCPFGFLAEGDIARSGNADKEKLVEIYRKGLEQNPDNAFLALHLAFSLAPPDKTYSEEIIKCLDTLASGKRLSPNEYVLLARAHIASGKPENARVKIEEAISNYPNNPDLLYDLAHALFEEGNEPAALRVLEEYVKRETPSLATLQNIGMLAGNTGEMDLAISMFQKALSAAKETKTRRLIHLQLYNLKRKRGHDTEAIIRHIVGFGELIEDDSAEEARYIMMSLTLPVEKDDIEKPIVKKWREDLNKRLHAFTEKYPDYPALSSMTIPDDIPVEKHGEYILLEISKRMLPHYLATVGLQISTRGLAWPLCVRAHLLPRGFSTFHYWSFCANSKEFSDAIHIWYPPGQSDEIETLRSAKKVCIDLTALLTLAEFSLLDEFTSNFDQVILAHGTRVALQIACNPPFETPHPLAESIEEWRLRNRRRIRVRSLPSEAVEKDSCDPESDLTTKDEESLDKLVPDGVGESVLLAKSLGFPLYSDEAVIRHWASTLFSVKTFSTLALAKYMRQSGQFSLSAEGTLFARMIRKNFRILPFIPDHMLIRLKEVVQDAEKKVGKALSRDDIQNDEILGAFLKEFGEPRLDDGILTSIALGWWIAILGDDKLRSVLESCMEYPSFALMTRTKGGVIAGIDASEYKRRAAALWAKFLWTAYLTNPDFSSDAWLAIKHVCSKHFREEKGEHVQVLFEHLPVYLARIIEMEKGLSATQKLNYSIDLQKYLQNTEPGSDRYRFAEAFQKSKPRFFDN